MRHGALTAVSLALALALVGRAEAASPIGACGSLGAGSYILTANLTATGDCLVVTAHFVTINLGGFTISGNGTGRGIWDGLDIAGTRLGVAIRGPGTIQNFATGIDLRQTTGAVVTGVRVSRNAGRGMDIGQGSLVRGNVADRNGPEGTQPGGIAVARNSLVAGNTASENLGFGILVSGASAGNSLVTGNTASHNSSTGLAVAAQSAISNNTASSNFYDGLSVACPSNVVANTAADNVGLNLSTFGIGCQLVDTLK
jgi:parallel beta-helix repeat protein